MTSKAERKQRSHEAILASAAALLRQRGIQASSVADVMKGAGLTVGGFYAHFASKEQLFVETIQSAHDLRDRFFASAKGETPRERLLHVVKGYLSRLHRDRPQEGCILPTAAPEAAREGEPYRGALEGELAHFQESLAALLASGPEGERMEKALGLIATMVGALSLSRAVAGTPMSDEILRAARRLAEEVVGDGS